MVNHPSKSEVLRLCALRAGYLKSDVLSDVSLSVHRGEIICLLGSNGAGKTTTIRAISGEIAARGGEIILNGSRIDGLPAQQIVRMGLATVPEGRSVFPTLTVAENLRIGAYSRRSTFRASEFDEVFTLFPRLAERIDQQGGTLSGGEQQMLAIGRALMSKPAVLLLDEPSMGLAPIVVELVFGTIAKLAASGISILLVEQNANAALEISQRGYVMERGRIALSGTADELMRNEAVRSAYLG
ncbi:ABC transporter ATP-binding protein [Bradyrhizobium sp. DASA03007]|uniref:ABC transporter ATP-binding protein n=1 Tax=unclassified Bradyrhizobium TaxID=2631580 RepID=UPI003F6E859E